MDFTNKVVIITGASAGIGASAAFLFAAQSANVVLVGRNISNLNENAKKCEDIKGIKPLIVQAELTKDEDVKNIVTKTIDKFGRIDVLVNNAGIGLMSDITDGIEHYDKAMNTNIRPAYLLSSSAIPFLIKSKGNIVNVSSVAGTRPIIDIKLLTYGMSKAAMDQFTKYLALEIGPVGVRVNSVNPGATQTDIMVKAGANADDLEKISKARNARNPLRKMATCEEVADLIVYLASERARSITGSLFVIDNGESLL